jgi:DNA-binding transcriptional ArsR family regulator
MSLERKKSNELKKAGKSIEITNKLIREIDSRKNKIQCPRCLGKGHVDNEDIKRLKKEFYWAPGPCAYCEGIGSVTSDIINSVEVDEAYLTFDLSPVERTKFLLKDNEAVERSKMFKSVIEYLKDTVIRLYSLENKNINEITEAILNDLEISNSDEVKELKEFIETVIKKYDE